MQKFTFHVVGLPHTKINKDFLPCAYTQKVLNFCKMMKSLGHTVYMYGGEGSDPQYATEFVSVISDAEQQEFFGHTDWRKDFFSIDWDQNLPYWKLMNDNVVKEMTTRIAPTDFICVIGGNCQQPITLAFQKNLAVEFGVGYKGIFTPHRVFESYAWMHHVYGLNAIENGGYFDCVIPNFFDPADFPFAEDSEREDDYFLFVGRMIARKGVHVAAEVCGRKGAKLKLAGQGIVIQDDGSLKAKEFELPANPNFEYLGTVDVKQRGELMSKAKALFVPTQYIGPFEGVHIEAMLCGIPVITTDWGVFAETVSNGFNGYRTRTVGEMEWAMDNVDKLDRKAIRQWAQDNFSIDRVRYQYQAYFEQLFELWKTGWYTSKHEGLSEYNRYNQF